MPMTKDEKKKKIETIIRETIASIEGGEPELPFDDNDMSQEELNRWKSNLIFHGVCALRATRVQDYRRSNSAASR